MRIRLATADDAAGIAAIYDPIVRDTPLSFEDAPPGISEMRRRIVEELQHFPWLVADDGTIAGYAYAGPHRARAAYRWAVETSLYVRPDVHRQGVGKALYGALFRFLEAQYFRRAVAVVEGLNAPSIAFHEAMGFVHVATYRRIGYTLGAWHDITCLERFIGPDSGDRPAEPVPVGALDIERLLLGASG